MSKVAIQGNASGTGVFTIASPNSNTDRVITLPDEAGTVLTRAAGSPDDSVVVNASGNVGIGTSSPSADLDITKTAASLLINSNGQNTSEFYLAGNAGSVGIWQQSKNLIFRVNGDANTAGTNASEAMRITSAGQLLYAAGAYASSKRVTDLIIGAGNTETLFNLWNGNAGRGQYLVSVTRISASVGTKSLAIVASSSSTLSIVYTVIETTGVTIGVSGSSVTATNTTSNTIAFNAIAIPLAIEGN